MNMGVQSILQNGPVNKQMSEATSVMVALTLSGGMQDAYSYFLRDKVFANAQTGNIVLMSVHLFEGDVKTGLRYLFPVLFFAFGVFAAQQIRTKCKEYQKLHWRQLIVALEILLLLLVGFVPLQSGVVNLIANALTSFCCAMQVQAFRKVNGHAYASTMCIGNMRSGTDALCAYFHTHDKKILQKSMTYFAVIGVFAVGAGIGSVLTKQVGERGIWVSCVLLTISFLMMFVREDVEKA